MSRCPVLCWSLLVSAILAGPAFAAGCKEPQAWRLVHEKAKRTVETFDVKGSRNTSIEICREAEPSGAEAEVTVAFEGKARPLPEGDCQSLLARWAVVRSVAAAGAPAEPAVVKGTATVCRE